MIIGSCSGSKQKCLVVEDYLETTKILNNAGYDCDRVTHEEVLSRKGDEFARQVRQGEYKTLWVMTPSSWHARSRKHESKMTRLQYLLQTALTNQMNVVIFGPPGYLWKQPLIHELMETYHLQNVRLRLCSQQDKFDKTSKQPSGAYFQMQHNLNYKSNNFRCRCGVPIDQHNLDWYGRSELRSMWRQQMYHKYLTLLANDKILDLCFPPSAIDPPPNPNKVETFPTEARLKQKSSFERNEGTGSRPQEKKQRS